LRRLIPVLEALPEAFGGTVPIMVSVDTTKSIVARAALARGATTINDIWGFQGDPALPAVVAEGGASAVLMHNRCTVDDTIDIMDDMRRFFERSLGIAERAGVPQGHLILDPGVGFGKTQGQQLAALANLDLLKRAFGLPVLVGASRKSFLRPLVGDDEAKRLAGTLAANLAAYTAGARVFRVHDVASHVAAFSVFRAVAEAGR
jgi:dihydropteroate synthase